MPKLMQTKMLCLYLDTDGRLWIRPTDAQHNIKGDFDHFSLAKIEARKLKQCIIEWFGECEAKQNA